MQEAQNYKYSNDLGDEIDLLKLFYILLEGKWIIVSITGFVSIIAVIYSLLLPNIYESKALLAPANQGDSISQGIGAYSAIAGIAGVRLPNGGDQNNYLKAVQKISSLSFFKNDIMPNIHLPDLMAIKSWNSSINTVIYDESIYDINNGGWVREYSYPKKQIPSAQESFKVFKNNHLSFSEDLETGFSTLTIKHQSPFIAKQWAELIVNKVNSFYRQKDKSETEKAVGYLYEQISLTSLSEIKQVLAQLLQDETKKLTLIEANQFYVFDYIDPPAVMEQKSEPRRALICIFGAILGGMLSIIIVLLKHHAFSRK
jgi:hypothetical protein